MKAFPAFLLGVVVGVAAHWYFTRPESQATVADAKENVRNTAPGIEQSLKGTFDTDRLKAELARSGKVIREKARQAGESFADSTANVRTTATIKGKLLNESNLAALKIDVDTVDGVVTLSGTVSSHEEIAKAMSLALETEGVHKVVSTLQVKSIEPSERQTKEISR